MKLQVLKFGSNCLFKNGKINYHELRRWAEEIKKYENETGIKTYIRSSGAVAIEKFKRGITKSNSEMSTEKLVWLAGQGQHKMMGVWEQVFDKLYHVSQVQLTAREKSDLDEGLNFANSVFYDLNHGTIPISNYNDRMAFEEVRKDNDLPGARDAALFHSIENIDVIRYLMVGTENGFYKNIKDKSTLIKDIGEITDEHYSYCAQNSSNGTGGPAVKLDASKMVTSIGIESMIAHVKHGLYDNINRTVENTLFHAKQYK